MTATVIVGVFVFGWVMFFGGYRLGRLTVIGAIEGSLYGGETAPSALCQARGAAPREARGPPVEGHEQSPGSADPS